MRQSAVRGPLARRLRLPGCGGARAWTLKTKADTFECASCGRQTSVTAGTVLHASKLPLTVWFLAAFLMATHSNGISALQLPAQLGLGSYRTAWMLAAKLRRADAGTRPPSLGRSRRGRREQPAVADQGRSAGRRPGAQR